MKKPSRTFKKRGRRGSKPRTPRRRSPGTAMSVGDGWPDDRPTAKGREGRAWKAAETPISNGDGEDLPMRLYINDIRKHDLLTPEEEADLARRMSRGDKEAKNKMILCNLRLVVKIANGYKGLGLPLLDLISEGNIGLIKAVERFELGKGAKLSTYASWWIKQTIRRALANQSRTIRLPVHAIEKVSKMCRTMDVMKAELGREPADAEIAEHMGVPEKKVSQWKMNGTVTASLDAPLTENGNGYDAGDLSSIIPDDRSESSADIIDRDSMAGLVNRLIGWLEPREARIMRERFGMGGEKEKTLEQVGAKLGITRERVRQLQNAALKKLRFRLNGAKLDDLIEV